MLSWNLFPRGFLLRCEHNNFISLPKTPPCQGQLLFRQRIFARPTEWQVHHNDRQNIGFDSRKNKSSNPMEEDRTRTSVEWLILSIQIILVILTVAGNLLVIISIGAVKVLQVPRNYLILSLAIADFLVGFIVLPLKMILAENTYDWEAAHVACYVWGSGELVCCSASVLGLVVITLDRYIAIAHPLIYKVNVTSRNTLIAIATVWTVSFLIVVPNLALSDLTHDSKSEWNSSLCVVTHEAWFQVLGAVVLFFLPLSVMIFVYGKIWRILAAQKSKAVVTRQMTAREGSLSTTWVDAEENASPQHFLGRISVAIQERKGCIMLGIIVIIFILCWLPSFLMMLISGVQEISTGTHSEIPMALNEIQQWLAYLNSCINPLIYTMFSKEFRYAFKEILCGRGCTLNSRIRIEMYAKQMGNSAATNESISI